MSDLYEDPESIFATGVNPDGLRISGPYPSLTDNPAPWIGVPPACKALFERRQKREDKDDDA